ncbi:MAG: hypothetical protein LUD39_07170 [Opitutae bacterium]|nr:hypothetical protein [Opitutae bacterium]
MLFEHSDGGNPKGERQEGEINPATMLPRRPFDGEDFFEEMPTPANKYCGFILDRCVHGEKFWRVAILTREFGSVSCFVRISGKNKTTVVPDLFDEAEILLEKPKSGSESDPRFAKEYNLVHRNSGIAKSYTALSVASKFVAILAKNAFPVDSAESLYTLCANTFRALAEKPNPEACYLKALWTLARDGGYPVKEDWLKNSNSADVQEIVAILRSPLESVVADARDVVRHSRRLESWLEREHRFVLA